MAFRLTSNCRWVMNHLRGNAAYATSTSPKKKAHSPTINEYGGGGIVFEEQGKRARKGGDYVPVYVALGLITLQFLIGLHTIKQQLVYSPNVRVKKKLRQTMAEVDCPDEVVDDANKFIQNSYFRKLAHAQEFNGGLGIIPDSMRRDTCAYPGRAHTLNSGEKDSKPS